MFAHEKLEVYRKALRFVAAASSFVVQWDKRHAVTDQLARASDSLVLNLAEAARLRSSATKLRALDYSVGSCLECAAALDVARIKSLLARSDADHEKEHLCEVMRMLVGLRKAWASWEVKEEEAAYKTAPPSQPPLFHHEKLEVYSVSLELIQWFVGLPGANNLTSRLQRHIDESLTSIVLNIAEANGRYSDLDHHRFLDVAASSAVKSAAYLDLAVQKAVFHEGECIFAKELLERVLAMLSRM
jgi:four helix bundle protein